MPSWISRNGVREVGILYWRLSWEQGKGMREDMFLKSGMERREEMAGRRT